MNFNNARSLLLHTAEIKKVSREAKENNTYAATLVEYLETDDDYPDLVLAECGVLVLSWSKEELKYVLMSLMDNNNTKLFF